jgi:site-specific recombinase XerD
MKDIHEKDKYLQNKLDKIEADTQLSKRNKEVILKYLRDSELGKTVRKGQKREIGAGRNLQVAGMLIMMCKEWFKKDLDVVSQKDMETFILNLNKGIITTSRNSKDHKPRPYSNESKANIKKFIRKFYKWLLAENKYYPELVEWIDTSYQEANVQAIKGLDKGVWSIVELIPDIKRKALVWCTFDSGYREGEMLSCTIADVEKRDDGIYYLTCRKSKTKNRTVSLPKSSELLDRWLNEHPDKNNPNAELWQISRRMFYKSVKLYGMKALKTNVTVHQIRHSSATYYAPILDRTTFCKKFGWSYSSKTPDRYIDFAKVSENKVVDIIKADQYHQIKKEMSDVKLQNNFLKEQMQSQQEQMKNMKNTIMKDLSEDILRKINQLKLKTA